MTQKKLECTFDKTALKKPSDKTQLLRLLSDFQNTSIRVTFDHFRAASVITDRILGKAKKIDFNQYPQLVHGLNFKDPVLRELINNEMAIHDKFNEKTLIEQCVALKLPPNTDPIEVKIAYLKNEMQLVVARLQNPSYKALNHQQINTLVGQSQLILEHILSLKDQEKKQSMLLTIAIRTGSHCYRMYLETFADLFHLHVYQAEPLALKEKAALAAQSIREDEFKKYYYAMRPCIQKYYGVTMDVGYLLLKDKNDYHAYEFFAKDYGAFFYLQNESLSKRARGLYAIVEDYVNTYIFLPLIQKAYGGPKTKPLFSDYYNDECLINAAVDGQGKLHLIFKDWCNSMYPEAYTDLLFDEDLYPLSKSDPNIRAMARLMLLDLGLVELKEPYKKQTVTVGSTYGSLFSTFGQSNQVKQASSPLPKHHVDGLCLFKSNGLDSKPARCELSRSYSSCG